MIRKLEPQWGVDKDGKSLGNLGSFKVNAENPTDVQLMGMIEKSSTAFGEMTGGQLHIKFGSRVASALVLTALEFEMPQGKDEETPVYLERTYDRAREIARDLFGDGKAAIYTMDYVQAFDDWVDNVYNKRGATGDAVVKLIREKWATSTNEKRAVFLQKFGLDKGLLGATADEIIKAYKSTEAIL